jgi:hypothetical protein
MQDFRLACLLFLFVIKDRTELFFWTVPIRYTLLAMFSTYFDQNLSRDSTFSQTDLGALPEWRRLLYSLGGTPFRFLKYAIKLEKSRNPHW